MDNELKFVERIQHGWNAFRNKDPSDALGSFRVDGITMSPSSWSRPDRNSFVHRGEHSIVKSILNRMAVDASSAIFEHIKTDESGRFLGAVNSGLNNILTWEANIDQSGSAFILDVIESLFDEGCVAMVPIDTERDPEEKELSPRDIYTMRTGRITGWWADQVAVDVYNEQIAARQTILVPKRSTAIVENPFYSIMNSPNSTLKRLNRRLVLLDISDEKAHSNKLDLIVQLPYVLKHKSRENQAQKRRDDIVEQLSKDEYGIAYTDGTEKIIQLNRPVENNLMSQIEYLTKNLYDQLGITPEIINMTADEQTMTNYYKRCIDPILNAIMTEMRRKFLTKTARSQHQTIQWYRDPFTFTTATEFGDLADSLVRNEVATQNDMRAAIGWRPSNDPKADTLRNPNMPTPDNPSPVSLAGYEGVKDWPVKS